MHNCKKLPATHLQQLSMCERIRFVISLVYNHRYRRSSTVTEVKVAPPRGSLHYNHRGAVEPWETTIKRGGQKRNRITAYLHEFC